LRVVVWLLVDEGQERLEAEQIDSAWTENHLAWLGDSEAEGHQNLHTPAGIASDLAGFRRHCAIRKFIYLLSYWSCQSLFDYWLFEKH